jgi:carbon monoxide dehydrogenase subunit G
MRLENSFTVPADPDAAWALLTDVPRVVPCMPGATLDEVIDESHWKATIKVKLGPVSLSFVTDVTRDELDEAGRRVVLRAEAREARNRGGATAVIESSVDPADEGTRVRVVTDLTMSGAVAQFGRGAVQDVSAQLVERFAEGLRGQLAAVPAAAPTGPSVTGGSVAGAAATGASATATVAPPPPTEAISALGLGARGILRALARALARVFRRRG